MRGDGVAYAGPSTMDGAFTRKMKAETAGVETIAFEMRPLFTANPSRAAAGQ